jgi:hypothetical protein
VILLAICFGAICIGLPTDGKYILYHRLGASLFFFAFEGYIFMCQFTRFRNRKISFDTLESKTLTPDKIVIILLLIVMAIYIGLIVFQVLALLPLFQKITVIFFLVTTIMLDNEDF